MTVNRSSMCALAVDQSLRLMARTRRVRICGCCPFAQDDGRAYPDPGLDFKLVDETLGTRKATSQAAARGKAGLHRLPDVGNPWPVVAHDDDDAPSLRPRDRIEAHFTRPGVDNHVPGKLGDCSRERL